MLSVYVENIGGMTIIECEGRIIRSEAAYKIREAVNSQRAARVLVFDLSEVQAIDGEGLATFVFLQGWADTHGTRLKLFNPRHAVRDKLEHVSSMREFDIATLDEMVALLAREDSRYARVA